MIKVLIDGVEVSAKMKNDIRVIVEEVGEDKATELHFTFTHEGLITDMVCCGEIEGSTSAMYEEIYDAEEDNEA